VIGAIIVAVLVVLSATFIQVSSRTLPLLAPEPARGLPSALLDQCQGSPLGRVCLYRPFMPPEAKRT
jgi:hypothetical protein